MKTAAMTRIHRSKQTLGVWLDYYSRFFDELYVFTGKYNGKEADTFDNLKAKYNFSLIALPDEFYSMTCHEKVFAKQRELLVDHSWVIYSDTDEIVIADPEKYDGLRHFMADTKLDQTFCRGYDVFQRLEELNIDYTKPYLAQRTYWCPDATKSYHKPCLSRIPTDWAEGFHYIKGREQEIEELSLNTDLFLIHLKHADRGLERDFPMENTGTHGNTAEFEKNGCLIPDKVRRIF